ncbi:hypothetical protein CspHIS471_0507050 [Cutaneotrichosporon sp. HIS471]|nr:hypothetical protein CspHIS471_0507050 [Cutaneotrichosporon sp. HIS471]
MLPPPPPQPPPARARGDRLFGGSLAGFFGPNTESGRTHTRAPHPPRLAASGAPPAASSSQRRLVTIPVPEATRPPRPWQPRPQDDCPVPAPPHPPPPSPGPPPSAPAPLAAPPDPATGDIARLICTGCRKTFINLDGLRRHMQRCKSPRPLDPGLAFLCPECDLPYETEHGRATHIRLTHLDGKEWTLPQLPQSAPFECPDCGKVAARRHYLIAHWEKEHSANPPPPRAWDCTLCPATFATQAGFYRHRRAHVAGASGAPPAHTCDLCGATFSRKEALAGHRKKDVCKGGTAKVRARSTVRSTTGMHLAAGQLKCPVCEQDCPGTTSLRQHILGHAESATSFKVDNPSGSGFQCVLCLAPYTTLSSVMTHLLERRCPAASASTGFICDTCGFEFTSQRCLREHVARDTCRHKKTRRKPGSGPLTCSDCGYTFASASTLGRHVAEDTCQGGTRPVRPRYHGPPTPCDLCGRTFKTWRGRKLHIETDVCEGGTRGPDAPRRGRGGVKRWQSRQANPPSPNPNPDGGGGEATSSHESGGHGASPTSASEEEGSASPSEGEGSAPESSDDKEDEVSLPLPEPPAGDSGSASTPERLSEPGGSPSDWANDSPGEDWLGEGGADAPGGAGRPPASPATPPSDSLWPRILTWSDLGPEAAIARIRVFASKAGLARPAAGPPARPNTTRPFPVFDPADRSATPSRLDPDAWYALLADYPIPSFREAIVGMIRHGAKLGYEGPLRDTVRRAPRNHPMEEGAVAAVRASVASAVQRGLTRVHQDGAPFVQSPVGAVPKRGGSSAWRMINDLSWPRVPPGTSVNDGIDMAEAPLTYSSIDELFEVMRVRHNHTDTALWKVDLKDAYRHIVVAEGDTHLLGFSLDGGDFVDCALNFGGRSSPFIFNMFAEALHWILASWGLDLQHFLDDFFGACRPGQGEPILQFFAAICGYLGLEVAKAKCGQGRCLEILGVIVDGPTASAWLAERKLLRIRHSVSSAIEQRTIDVQFAESLVGSLQDACKVCPVGRAFTSGFYDLIKDAKAKRHNRAVIISRDLAGDLRWWRRVIRGWPGIRLLHPLRGSEEIWTDAATSGGIGGHLGPRDAPQESFARPLPESAGTNIMTQEAYAVLEGLQRWGPRLAGFEIRCHVDNQAVAEALRSGRIRHRPTQVVVRRIFTMAHENRLVLTPIWIPTARAAAITLPQSRAPLPLPTFASTLPTLPTHTATRRNLVTLTNPAAHLPPPPANWHNIVRGSTIEAELLWYGLAPSTRQSYEACTKSYVRYARRESLSQPYFPTPPSAVSAWLADEALRLHQMGVPLYKHTLTAKLSGLASFHTDLGYDATAITSGRVKRVIDSAKRKWGVVRKEQPWPITLPVLTRILAIIAERPQDFGGPRVATCLRAAFALAFACFLRMGELTHDTFDARFCLARRSLTLAEPDGTGRVSLLHIPASKTDPFRVGVSVVVPYAGGPACPVTLLREWMDLTSQQDPDEPLFTLPGRAGAFPRKRVVAYLAAAIAAAGLPARQFSGHSFRRGAATWAQSIGIPRDRIQMLGRWASDAYKRYVDTPLESLQRSGAAMLLAAPSASTLPANGVPRQQDMWQLDA